MSCEEYREQLITHVCGELPEQESAGLLQHLESCLICRETAAEYRAIEGLMHRLPEQEYSDKLRIRDMMRHRRGVQMTVLGRAALWIVLVLGAFSALSFLPVHGELSSGHFSIRWGSSVRNEPDLGSQVKQLQQQLIAMQNQNQQWEQASELRIKQMLDQNNVQQQKRYFQTLQLFSDYAQVQRKADLQRINHDIALNYDRTGQEVDRTNELLQYMLKTSATQNGGYTGD